MTIQTIIGRGVDLVPDSTLNRSTYWILYFTGFMLIGSIFFINLFVGVVQSTFRSEHDRVGGDRLLTEKQKEWIELKLLVLRSAPIAKIKAPENQFRRLCFKIEQHVYFERFIQIAILLNTVTLVIKWYREPGYVNQISEILNNVFTAIFLVEALIRLIGIGVTNYFKENWNRFDFFIALGSVLSIIITYNTEVKIYGTTILRSFRFLRLLRLLKRGGKGLNHIFNTFEITL